MALAVESPVDRDATDNVSAEQWCWHAAPDERANTAAEGTAEHAAVQVSALRKTECMHDAQVRPGKSRPCDARTHHEFTHICMHALVVCFSDG